MSSLASDVHLLRDSYRAGALTAAATAPYKSDLEQWTREVRGRVKARLPLDDQRVLAQCRYYYTKGRAAAGAGHTIEACEFFAQARRFAATPALAAEACLLCGADLASAEAYLEYCCGDYDSALTWLDMARARDGQLEEEYGYRLLLAHRIHVTAVIVRVIGRAARAAEALTLARDVLRYIGGRGATLPGGHGQSQITALPPRMIEWAIWQHVCEVAMLLATMSRQDARRVAPLVFEDPETIACGRDWPAQAREWFALQRTFLHADAREVLQGCAAFVAAGPRQNAALWRLAALDAAAVLEHYPQWSSVRREILDGVSQWKAAPRPQRSALLQVQHRWRAGLN
jgi:hypothetical protein